jgi:tetratricopeptide (TPR) repeat protein
MDLGRPLEAAPSFLRALEIYEHLEETEHEHYAKTSMALGTALRLLGYYRDARNRLERALRLHRQVLREDDPQIAKPLILLGALLAEQADCGEAPPAAQRREILDAARGYLEEALGLLEQFWGEDHPLTAGVLAVAANVAEAEDRQYDASSRRRVADAVRAAVLTSADADFLAEGANIFASRGLYDEAELYGRRSLELRRAAAEDGTLDVAEAEFALGRLLQLRGRDPEAAEHLQQALDLGEAILGEYHPETELVRACLTYLWGRGT